MKKVRPKVEPKKVMMYADDIGFVQYVDHMGDDLSVVNAARVSYEKSSDWEPEVEEGLVTPKTLKQGDKKLISYLTRHNHWTPFGHVQVSLRVKAPISVARQLVKHQVGLVWNEVSRRYVSSSPEFYFPEMIHEAPENSKQGASIHRHKESDATLLLMREMCAAAATVYEELIEEGVAPEEARMILPLNTYTEWVWSGSLAAWARVYKLRADSHTQGATQQFANALGKIVEDIAPVSWKALTGEVTYG